MFSIGSLASAFSMDVNTLLSSAELSRISWRPGAHGGEFIVEIDSAGPEDEDLEDLELGDMYGTARLPRAAPRIHTTTVGVYEDDFLPGYHKVYTDREKNRRTNARSRASACVDVSVIAVVLMECSIGLQKCDAQ